MTLRTITFDDSTHKVVPLEPTEIQIQQGCISQTIGNFASYEEWWNAHSSGVSQRIRDLIAKYYRYMIAAAPEQKGVDTMSIIGSADAEEGIRILQANGFCDLGIAIADRLFELQDANDKFHKQADELKLAHQYQVNLNLKKVGD